MARVLSQFPLRKLLQSILVSAVVAILTAFAAVVVSYLLFPVTGIEVHGARMFPESEAWKAVPNHASLLSLNSDALEKRIKSNPWVKGVKVLKDWESGIVTIEVEERRAVLNGELDGRRMVLAADGTELPGLGGVDLNRLQIDEAQLEEVLRVGETLEKNGVVLDSVDEVGAGGVEMTVEGRRVLFAGGLEDAQARALVHFMEKHPDVPYFDLRSPWRIVFSTEADEKSVDQVTSQGEWRGDL